MRARYAVPLALLIGGLGLGGGFVWLNQFRPPQDASAPLPPPAPVADDLGWTNVGGDAGHSRRSTLAQIDRGNVAHLVPAWTWSSGEMAAHPALWKRAKMQVTPILAGSSLVACTPFSRVVALDPATGTERWRFDPQVDLARQPSELFNCRGLAQWTDATADAAAACARRVVVATTDRRLIALDAQSGQPCPGFGQGGTVAVAPARALSRPGELQFSSAPAIVGDTLVVGTASGDNQRTDAADGTVFAFSMRDGRPLWTFDPVPRGDDPIASPTWGGDSAARTGQANVWGSISADPERDLVFLPTSSPSPDFFGGLRPGDNRHANSMVALRASTGAVVWSFQTVHHDLWDADIPAGPSLLTLRRDGRDVPALAFATKMGFLFVLDRETGAPLYRVEERPVPPSDIPGEVASPTQPFSTLPIVAPQAITPDQAFGVTPFDRQACRERLQGLRHDGLFTPPSLQGTAFFPFTGGGANWGGLAVAAGNRLVVNTSRAIHIVRLFPQADLEAERTRGRAEGAEVSPQAGAPFGMRRELLLSPLGLPCNPPPWGALTAVDLDPDGPGSSRLAWEVPLGTTQSLAPLGLAFPWGTPNFGGPLVTDGGLVFIGAALEPVLRAFDLDTGREVWAGPLPAGGQATPMTYAVGGRQYVVIAAAGHPLADVGRSDSIAAFALPPAR
ncbi:pyrroloquinoline quinone-dependent dehydrogenase [Zavarzinia sp. CC-PAN008]|uniref:pyrroloquinoline quinone-dependent dehydrogenase n=1 Tax=Zavarzinia sp. CC-PAN008 TaxID=3243332 RepID=UPI003F744E4A